MRATVTERAHVSEGADSADVGLIVNDTSEAAADAAQALRAALAAEGLDVRLAPGACAGALADAPSTPAGPQARAWLLDHPATVSTALPRLRRLRERLPQAVLALRCPAPREVDEVLALEVGADLVLPSAQGAVVIAARLRALWRVLERLPAPPATAADAGLRLQFGRLHIDRGERRATLAGHPLPLTEGEFEVLWLLASHSGEPLSRRELLARLRGADGLDDGGPHDPAAAATDAARDRSIDSRVYRLRGKLGGGGAHGGIRTVRHRGYLFTPSAW